MKMWACGVAGAVIVATGLAADPASARDRQFYVGAGAGVMLAENPPFELAEGVAIIESNATLGWEGELFLGYDAGPLRLELEGGYRRFSLSAIDGRLAGVPVLAPSGSDNGLRFADFADPQGSIGSFSAMSNALIDFGGEKGIGLAAGVGIGVARPLYSRLTVDRAGPGFLDDSDISFAWQMLGQLRVPVSSTMQAALEYKYHRVEDVRVADRAGRALDSHLATHSLLASVIVPLGRARPAAPPRAPIEPTPMAQILAQPAPAATPPPAVSAQPAPAQPAPAPSPPAPSPPAPSPPARAADAPPAPRAVASPSPAVCNQGPYTVFFEWDSAQITPEAATVLNNAIRAYRDCGTAPIVLAGHTDRSGPEKYNRDLATRRDGAVAAYMIDRGVPAERISSLALGEQNPRVPTLDGVRASHNRRVEITFGPGSGT